MNENQTQHIIEAALMVYGQPLTISDLQKLFPEDQQPSNAEIKSILNDIAERHQDSGITLQEVASGYRLQAKTELSPWLAKLWAERPPRYSRALLETLAIIAYKQPITRAEIEEIRGVTVSSPIIKTLLEREWIRIVGYREVPGRPGIYGTTKEFLDHFNLKNLSNLPALPDFKTFEAQDAKLQVELAMDDSGVGITDSQEIPEEHMPIEQDNENELGSGITKDL